MCSFSGSVSSLNAISEAQVYAPRNDRRGYRAEDRSVRSIRVLRRSMFVSYKCRACLTLFLGHEVGTVFVQCGYLVGVLRILK